MSAITPIVTGAKNQRLMALDVFRGFTILLMIVVNNSGAQSFAPLLHSEWNGWTLTDLVFPSFLFITGVSLTFSFASRELGDGSRLGLLPHTLRRSAIIFCIGLLINAFPHYHLATWRFAGVLQRIAVCYLAGSVLYLWTGTRTRWMVIGGLLVGYWLLMRFVPVPGFGVPGVDVPLLDPDRNIVAWLDRKVMLGHLYEKVRDPEGILSTFPAIANTLFGIAVGEWIRGLRGDAAKLPRRLVAAGVACFVVGEIWGVVFPINKKLWTSSYVLITVGLAMLVLAACYWLVDVKKMRGRWTIIPLVFGTNCIFAYSFSEFVAIAAVAFRFQMDGRMVGVKDVINSFTFDNIAQPQWAALGYAAFFTAFCWYFTWLLYRRRVFLKV
ncbi:MAG TPA: heparan-alpha-glucosaminide N-acetyltransferase domain-containing protein [Candidatus Saccharimonadales bacterium]|nr:heparan-alpha-glucosaminide N-acetyltransferase domain-containing protein [Candidatus Saccharimonadales bacterium]